MLEVNDDTISREIWRTGREVGAQPQNNNPRTAGFGAGFVEKGV